MPDPDLSKRSDPLGPLRDRRVLAIGADDYVNERGFICQVNGAGVITYRTLEGAEDQTETGRSAGDVINVANIPVVLRAIRGSGSAGSRTTVTSVIIGVL